MPITTLTGDGITPKNNNVAEVNAIVSPAINRMRLTFLGVLFFIFIVCLPRLQSQQHLHFQHWIQVHLLLPGQILL
jgi:hypothetical protein